MGDFQELSTHDFIKAKGIIFWMNLIESEGINNLNDCCQILKHFSTIVRQNKQEIMTNALANIQVENANIKTVQVDDDDDYMKMNKVHTLSNNYGEEEIKVEDNFDYKYISENKSFDREEIKDLDVSNQVQLDNRENEELKNINILENFDKQEREESRNRNMKIWNNTENSTKGNDFTESSNKEKFEFPNTVVERDASKTIKDNKKVHACEYCPYKSSIFGPLKIHVRDFHNDFYEIFLDTHNLLFKYQCAFCEDKFKTVFIKTKHVEVSHPEKWDEYVAKFKTHKCNECDGKFFTTHRLRQHLYEKHNKMNSIVLPDGTRKRLRKFTVNDGLNIKEKRKCPLCPRILSDAILYTDHLAVHAKGPHPYTCDKCEYKCTKRRKLVIHVRTHNQSPILCDPCGEMFQSQFEFEKHNKSFHKPVKIYKSKPLSTIRKEPTGNFICDTCGKKFIDQVKLTRHTIFVHVDSTNMISCDLCEYKAKHKNTLNKHKLLHFPPSKKCDECDQFFATTVYLRRHKLREHISKDDLPFQCDKCEKGFVSRPIYEGHVNMHLGLKPEKCRYCDKSYQNVSNCLHHEKKVHKDVYVKKIRKIRDDFT